MKTVTLNNTQLRQRLLSARSVLNDDFKVQDFTPLKDCTFDLENKKLVGASGRFELLWQDDGLSSHGSVSLYFIPP